jgi:hypothetical protein
LSWENIKHQQQLKQKIQFSCREKTENKNLPQKILLRKIAFLNDFSLNTMIKIKNIEHAITENENVKRKIGKTQKRHLVFGWLIVRKFYFERKNICENHKIEA